jgi:hypothetical protein
MEQGPSREAKYFQSVIDELQRKQDKGGLGPIYVKPPILCKVTSAMKGRGGTAIQ